MVIKESKSPAERFDDLYKWLLTPTTLLILICHNVLNNLFETVIERPESRTILPAELTASDMLLVPQFISIEVATFVLCSLDLANSAYNT